MTDPELQALINRTALAVAQELRQDVAQTPELMTKKELAVYLRCDISKVNRYMGKGLPYEPFGSSPRFRKTSIDRWLQSEHIQTLQGQAA
jgi:hypothetical protein